MDMEGKGNSRNGEHGELALVLDTEDAQVELDPEVRLQVPRLAEVILDPDTNRAVDLGHPDGHGDARGATEVALEAARLDGGQEWVLHVDSHLVAVRNEARADVDIGGELVRNVYRQRARSNDDAEGHVVPRGRGGRGGCRHWC